jgi:hypothetical protein
MRNHPLAKPTVFISSMPALRARRAATRLIGPKRRLRRMMTAVALVAVAGGIGALYSARTGDPAHTDQGTTFEASSTGCQTPVRST